jgi:hypothetical protein
MQNESATAAHVGALIHGAVEALKEQQTREAGKGAANCVLFIANLLKAIEQYFPKKKMMETFMPFYLDATAPEDAAARRAFFSAIPVERPEAQPAPQQGVRFSFVKQARSHIAPADLPTQLLQMGIEDGESLLMAWKRLATTFPEYAARAQKALAVPAGSAGAERMLSRAKRLFRPDRSQLTPQNLESSLLLAVLDETDAPSGAELNEDVKYIKVASAREERDKEDADLDVELVVGA